MAISSISSVDLASVAKPPGKAAAMAKEASGQGGIGIDSLIDKTVKESSTAATDAVSANFQINKNVDSASLGTKPRNEQVSGKPSVNLMG